MAAKKPVVTDVNGQLQVLQPADVIAPSSLGSGTASSTTFLSGGNTWVPLPVTSVFGRTGAIVAQANDYTFAQLGGKPTTRAGYGITDAAPSSHVGSGGTEHAVVTTTVNGFMASTDKTKLDGIATGATANTGTVTSVAVANATGITWTGSPITGSGTLTPTLSENLQAWSGVATSAKEPAITAGTTAQYWRGDKTWQDFATDVRSAVLTGLSTATNTVIAATDTVLSALGKLQAQLAGKANLAGATFSGTVTINNSALRLEGWPGSGGNDGVLYMGAEDSYIYKQGGNFLFKSATGGYTATLNAGGTIWTSSNFDPSVKAPLNRPQFADWVGIGTSADRPLSVNSDASTLPGGNASVIVFGSNNQERMELRSAGPAGNADPTFQGKASQGSIASPTATQSGSSVCNLAGSGYDGSDWVLGNRAIVRLRASENWTPTAQGTEIVLATTSNGSAAFAFRWGIAHNGHLLPQADNAYDVGSASLRPRQYYGANAAISTSDARLKTPPRDMTDAEVSAFAAIARLPNVWQWIARVEYEGDAARLHAGPTVQDAIALMDAHGLTWSHYAAFCHDAWGEEAEVIDPETGDVVQAYRPAGDRYSFRREELLAWIVRAQAAQFDNLAARVATLESNGA